MGSTVKNNKIFFYIFNLFMILPFIIKNFSLEGFAAAAVILLLLLYFMVFKSDEALCASSYIPSILFCDFWVYIGVHFESLKEFFDIETAGIFLNEMSANCGYLFLIGCVLFGLSMWKDHLSWLHGFGAAAVGSALIFEGWSNFDFEKIQFVPGAKGLLAGFILSAAVWALAYKVSNMIRPANYCKNNCMGFILLFAVAVIVITEYNYINSILESLNKSMLALPDTLFAWWRVLLTMAVLILYALVMYNLDNEELSIDGLVCGCAATIVFGIKLLMCNYFCYSWLVMVVLLFSIMSCLKNRIYSKYKTLNLENEVYLIVQAVCLWAVVLLIHAGLWINVIISALFILFFYSQNTIFKNIGYKGSCFWIGVLGCIVSETMAWMWKFRFSTEGILLVAVIFVFAALAVLILNLKYPNGATANNVLRTAVAGLVLLLCLLAMGKNGSKIKVDYDADELTAVGSISTRGKGNEIKDAWYYWTDARGEMIGPESALKTAENRISVKGEVLTIVVIEQNGIRTSNTTWYPKWIQE